MRGAAGMAVLHRLGVRAVFLAWEAVAYRHHLRFVPESMNAWWVRYVSEEAWGFGAGGNEAGIIVYDMPDEAGEALQEKGMTWLGGLSPNSWPGRQGRFLAWHATPVPTIQFWADPTACPPKNK